MQYVVLKDEETGEVEIIGRFKKYGIGEIWQDNHWQSDSSLISNLFDGLLENVSEIEALRLIAAQKETRLQTVWDLTKSKISGIRVFQVTIFLRFFYFLFYPEFKFWIYYENQTTYSVADCDDSALPNRRFFSR